MLSFQVIDHAHSLIIYAYVDNIAVYIESVDHHATLRKLFTYDE